MDLIILCIELCVLNYGPDLCTCGTMNLCMFIWNYVCSIMNHSILLANVIIVV
jgi:hypothetical protein